MSEDKPKSARERAEARFSKAQRTTDESKSISEVELAATRGKTARLKALRLEKEAGEDQPEVAATRGYLSASELVLTFGLGKKSRVDKVTIHWPGRQGPPQVLKDVEVDKEHVVVQPGQ